MKALLFVTALSACSWTQFDDLADSTPTRAAEKPDGVKASDYGVIVVGATPPGVASGGTVAVLSSGPGNFSTLELDGKDQNLGDSEALGQHTIDSLTTNASLLFDGTSQMVLVDNSNVGTIIAIEGNTDGLSVDQQVGSSQHPIATAFANGTLVVAVEPDTANASAPNVFTVTGTSVVGCRAIDGGGARVAAAGVAIDGTKLRLYARTGAFFTYDLAAFDPTMCTATNMAYTVTPTGVSGMAGPAMNGGHVDLVAGKFAVLTAFDSASSASGAVQVVELAGMTNVGSPLAAPGARSATFDTFDGQGVVVLGYPGRDVGTTSTAGAVDLHTLSVDTGELSGTPAETLSVPNTDSNHLFGRSVTTTRYNGKPIVVVGASNVVYSFYATSLYQKR